MLTPPRCYNPYFLDFFPYLGQSAGFHLCLKDRPLTYRAHFLPTMLVRAEHDTAWIEVPEHAPTRAHAP